MRYRPSALTSTWSGPALDLTVNGNSAYQVFDIESSATATISGLTISNGFSATSGGGIENDGTLTLIGCTVSNNAAAINGGGIDNQGTLTLTGSTLSGNSALGNGGGIENDGTLLLANSTIAGNSATSGGGIENTLSLTMINCTVADNSASNNGGGIDSSGSTSIVNTIIAYNSLTGDGLGPDYNGAVTNDLGFNLVDDGSGSVGFTQSSDVLDEDPLLSSLGNYGGETDTLALLPEVLPLARLCSPGRGQQLACSPPISAGCRARSMGQSTLVRSSAQDSSSRWLAETINRPWSTRRSARPLSFL